MFKPMKESLGLFLLVCRQIIVSGFAPQVVRMGETNNVCTRKDFAKTCFVGLGYSSALVGTLQPVSAVEKAKRLPANRLPEEFDTPQLRGLGSDDNPTLAPFRTLPSGVQVTDIVVGKGPEVRDGVSVTLQWVLRRSNGYFVDSSATSNYDPLIYRVGDKRKVIAGFDEGIRGMKQGGKRRIVVPPGLGYVMGAGDNKPGPVPVGFGPQRQVNNRAKIEPFFFEVEVTRVREPAASRT